MITLDKRLDDLERWLTPRRFKLAFDLAKAVMKDLYDVDCPPLYLALTIGRDERTVRRWRTAISNPDRPSLDRINKVLARYLGPEWPSLIDSLLSLQTGGERDELD